MNILVRLSVLLRLFVQFPKRKTWKIFTKQQIDPVLKVGWYLRGGAQGRPGSGHMIKFPGTSIRIFLSFLAHLVLEKIIHQVSILKKSRISNPRQSVHWGRGNIKLLGETKLKS